MTKAREWPTGMRVVRDQAAECAMDGIRQLQPVVDGDVERADAWRRSMQTLQLLVKIAWLLEHAGAPIRPEDL